MVSANTKQGQYKRQGIGKDESICFGREPTPEEVAARLNVPVARVREVLKISRDPVSLDTPIGEEDDSHLGDFIEDDTALSPSDSAAFSMLREELKSALESLTDRERQVIACC